MKQREIFSGNTLEEVAEAFAEIVKRNYLNYLQELETATMDLYELWQWQLKIENEPEVVKRNAYFKILKIMKEPRKENKKFFKKKWKVFREKHIISITSSSGFYENLLPDINIENSVFVNVEYLIDIRNLIINKERY